MREAILVLVPFNKDFEFYYHCEYNSQNNFQEDEVD